MYMKKTLLLIAAAVAMTATANELTVNQTETISACKYAKTTETVDVASSGVRMNAVADIAGGYLGKTRTNARDDAKTPYNTMCTVTLTATENAGEYYVSGIISLVGKVMGNYNESTGVLTIAAGQENVQNATYGPAKLYLMVTDSTYNPNVDIQMKVNDNGTISLVNGVGFIDMLSGDYEGYSLGSTYIGGFELIPINGTCKSDLVNADWTAATTPTRENSSATVFTEDGGYVVGIDGITWQAFTMDADGNVTFQTEPVYYYSTAYTVANMYHAGETSTGTFGINVGAGVTGKVDKAAGTMTLDPWCFVLTKIDTQGLTLINGRKSASVITFPAEAPTAITDVTETKTVKAVKVIENGQVYIVAGDKKYNMMGAEVK